MGGMHDTHASTTDISTGDTPRSPAGHMTPGHRSAIRGRASTIAAQRSHDIHASDLRHQYLGHTLFTCGSHETVPSDERYPRAGCTIPAHGMRDTLAMDTPTNARVARYPRASEAGACTRQA